MKVKKEEGQIGNKGVKITFRMTDKQNEELNQLVNDAGCNKSKVITSLIKKEYDTKF